MPRNRAAQSEDHIEIVGYAPGAIGRVVALHGTWYAENTGFDVTFEAKVARLMGEFFADFDPRFDGFWQALVGGGFAGSLTIHGRPGPPAEAKLRFFVVDPAFQGQGIGNRLLTAALRHCDDVGFPIVGLETFAGLDAARHLYERHGFRLTRQWAGETWGKPVDEQRFERRHPGVPANG